MILAGKLSTTLERCASLWCPCADAVDVEVHCRLQLQLLLVLPFSANAFLEHRILRQCSPVRCLGRRRRLPHLNS